MSDTFFDIVGQIALIVEVMFPVVFGLLVLTFFWGLALTLRKSGDEKNLDRAKKMLLWGVITIFVLVSIWGIVLLLSDVFGTPIGAACPPPQVNPGGALDTISSCL